MKHCLALLGAIILSLSVAMADDSRPMPASWSDGPISSRALDTLDTLRFDALDLAAIAAEDQQRQADGEPPRFAFPHPVSVDASQRGTRQQQGDLMVWRLRVLADQANLINFGFQNLYLPEGSRLYIYSGKAAESGQMDRFSVIGPYDARINQDHGEFWTPNLQGDQAIIEVNVPANLADQFRLELAQVSHGYRGFGSAALGYRQDVADRADSDAKQACETTEGIRSGACNQDVACLSDDDPWNDPRRSVGAYQRSGTFACTGSLVNNTANDQRLLFITARHCISPTQTPSIVVYWDYEWPTCRRPGAAGGTAVNPPDPNLTNSGGTFLASTSNPFGGNCTAPDECSDVFLLELNGEPNENVELHWAGWDRRPPPSVCAQGPGNSTEGLCATIHHPGVDEKRITWVAQDIQIGNISGAQNIHWHPFWHPNPPELPNMPDGPPATIPPAVTEPGSSGSPLYSADRRLLGVLSGGPAFCGATGANLSDFYGGIFHAWEGMGTATTRMRDYLDPLNTGALFIDGIDGSGFNIDSDVSSVSQCGFDDVVINLELTANGDFEGDVSLAASGLPGGASTDFSVNPVTVPGSSVLTLANLDQVGAGSYTVNIEGISGDFEASANISLILADGIPANTAVISPVDGALGVSTTPTVEWSSEQGVSFELEIASDADFNDVVYSVSVTGNSHEVADPLDTNTSYFVRVRAANDCGQDDWSNAVSFTTEALPGDCPIGTEPLSLLSENFDGGSLPAGWDTTGSSGAVTWVTSTAQTHSGSHSVFAQNIASVSDQRLATPSISLPQDAIALFLNFQNWQHIEAGGGTGCYDGGLLEVSTDGGATWTPVEDEVTVRDYDGTINGGFANPLAGLPAWCGDPRDSWERYSVNLGTWAGQDVRFRFRFGTDSSVSRVGWYVDSVDVRACVQSLPPEIFQDRFEELD
ncbi:MAG: choice-of-anchor J domain-containing protein [Wenzhouxiangella sp.]